MTPATLIRSEHLTTNNDLQLTLSREWGNEAKMWDYQKFKRNKMYDQNITGV